MSRTGFGAIAPFAILMLALLSGSQASAEPGALAGGGQIVAAPEPQAAVAKPAPKPIAITLRADIDLTTQRLSVTSNGRLMHVWPISSGTRGYETPRGTFRPQWTARMWFSKKYDNAPMPHSVFFNGGIATHATQAVNRLGTPASHGCIRLPAAAAATFYGLVHKHGLAATRIVVRGSPRFRDEVVARHDGAGSRGRVARPYGEPRNSPLYGYAPPFRQSYTYAGYNSAQPRRYYVQQRPVYGQMRYPQPGYARY